jgi:phosphoribosylanthranilate isomerase
VNASTVRDIVSRLPPEIVTIGVFRDQSPRQVIDAIQTAKLRGVQLHGHEPPSDAERIRPYCQVLIAAFPAGDPGLAHADDYGADAIMLDSHAPGSGEVFDWSLAEGAPPNRRIILAGGLTPENVAAGIDEVRPWGVDVATGVEADGQPGRKDPRKVRAFIHAARAAAPDEPVATGGSPGPFDWAESGI